MVDHGDSHLVLALQLTQVGEQGCHFGAVVLALAVQPDEWVEDEESGVELRHGGGQLLAIVGEVEAESGRGDDLDVEIWKGASGGEADALEPLAHGGRGVLGGVEDDPSRRGDAEAPETGRSRGHRHGHVEGEEGLEALGLAPYDSHCLLGPQAFDEPALLLADAHQLMCGDDGEHLHGRALGAALCPPRARPFSREAGPKTSRKSFSSSWETSARAPAASSSAPMLARTR